MSSAGNSYNGGAGGSNGVSGTGAVAGGEAVTFRDAIGNVEVLDEIPLPDPQPCIEAQPIPLQYRIDLNTNFQDKGAYITGVAKYTEEAIRHAELNEMLEEGFQHAVHLYTWRCCSRAIPMAKSNEQPNRVEIYNVTVEVLYPEVKKLLDFMYFQSKAINRFCEEVKRLCHNEKRRADFVSEAYLLTLGKFINMFAVLDELKNMKASIKNDYSTFRRAAQFLQVMSDNSTLQESQNLSMFLATHNKIRDTLKKALSEFENYEDLLADVINICMVMYENQVYVTPQEKHMLVKVLGFGLFLIDGEVPNVAKLDQRKKLNISKFDKVFKQLEVVPLFGDMNIQPFAFVKKSPHFDSSKWPNAMTESTTCQVNLIEKLRKIREEHTEYVTHLSRIHNEMAVYEKDGPRTDAENKELANLALRGLQLLASWTSDVVEMYSWKLLNPTDHHQNKECPPAPESEEYERATRYNYNREEKCALIEVISMIKGLQMLLGKMETEFSHAIRRFVYAELQEFVQNVLREPLRKATKNKKELVRSIIQSVRETCADYMVGYDAKDDFGTTGKKDHKKDHHGSAGDVRVPRKAVAPSSTQLYMVRTMLESLLCDRSSGKKTIRKDIDGQYLMAIDQFHKQSFFWPCLLNFSETLEECCDLSQLWYREFYLEMTMGERIQFPIAMSMPWILTDHVLKTKDPALTECLLYLLDLYNDSAQFALTKFKKQFLYDEIEAEVNLCFDQFIFKLSDQIFAHYKQVAANSLLDKRFKNDVAHYGLPLGVGYPPATRYHTLVNQRHVQLLGRLVDLNRLVTQRINIALRTSIDLAISRFEAGDLTDIMELEGLISVNELTHQLLKELLPGLTDFKDILLEANHNVSTPYGRITLHVIYEICYDFLMRYCYNAATDRFVPCKVLNMGEKIERSKQPQAEPHYFWGTKVLNSAFNNIFTMYKGFVGAPHFRVLAKLMGYEGIAVVLEELLKVCQNNIQVAIQPYCTKLLSVMPKVCKLPRHDYGSPGLLAYYNAQLRDIISYVDLRTEMFQAFRELGNSIIFCLSLEQALSQEEIVDILHAAPFQNMIPRPYCKEGEKPENKIKRLEQKYSKLHISNMMEKYGNPKQAAIAREGDLLTKERLCCGLSLFEMVLTRIKGFLSTDKIWFGAPPMNGVMSVDECTEFHRLWSAIQFVYCLPGGEHEFTVEQLFGEGLHWAGCAMIVLLGQQKRFEALDFSYHLLRVQRVDKKDDANKNLTRMVDRIRRFQVLNTQIFSLLSKHLSTKETSDGTLPIEHVRCFQPPVHASLNSSMQ